MIAPHLGLRAQPAGALPHLTAPAGGAEAVQLHLPPVDLEPVDGRPATVDPEVHAREVDVPDPAALPANEVMVLVGVDLELGSRTGPVERADQAFLDQLLEVPIHGRMGHRGQDLANLPDQIVGGRVVHRVAQDPEEHVALGGESQTTTPALLPEMGVALGGWR